jgi:hypothetical protein
MNYCKVRNYALLLIIFYISSVYAQDFSAKKRTDDLYRFYDGKVAIPIVDSLINSGCKEVVVIQTEYPFEFVKSADSMLTFICWKDNGVALVKTISSNVIYSTVNFKGESIFAFHAKGSSLATVEERSSLKFIPPFCNRNALYYFYGVGSGYFELPDIYNSNPVTYVPDPAKEKTRKEWFNLICRTLYAARFNFNVLNNYDRYLPEPVLK